MEQLETNIVTWLLIVSGWAFVHHATLIRERRKEKREISVQIRKDIADLQSIAIDFHTAPHYDSKKSTDLAQQVGRINIRLQRKPLSELGIPLAILITLRRQITKNNIDLSNFTPQQIDSKIIVGIRNAVNDLISLVEDNRECVWK